jgi:SpoVK/Ycf46/Vps4 family AAA+-type ATPase
VGVVCPGPNGVGKTFIAKAFVHDAGINAVSLRNFRGMYVGQTESNLDTIFNILKAMTPNIVVIDEADKTLGNERSDAGNKVDERVFGAFTAFMGDPEYRGKIFWMLLTARPFNLAPDTGRPGRVEEHLPILAPETFAEKKAVLKAVCESCGIQLISPESESSATSSLSTNSPTDDELKKLFAVLGFFTPAALELIGNRSRRRARRVGGFAKEEQEKNVVSVDLRVFLEEAESFVPEGSMLKQQLQTLEAVLYTNHLNYLPESWKSRLRDDVNGLSREREELLGLVASL